MRNKLNEVKEFDIISRCVTIRIAMFDEPYPYIVPVNFGEEIIGDQVVFYIHTDYEGKKNDLLAKNPNIAFEMDCNHELYYRESNMSCNFRYESVVGTGRVEIVPEEEREKALTLLMNHYHPESVKFNPLEYRNRDTQYGLAIIRGISEKIDYHYVASMNCLNVIIR